MGRSLENLTILVPDARVGQNMLAAILHRNGAEVRTFPTLIGRPPADEGPLERAIDEIERFDWVVFVGELGARFFLDRWGERGRIPAKIASIGKGTRAELRERHRMPEASPRDHVAQAVVDALGDVDGASVLLVRNDHSSLDLPEELVRRGAVVTDVIGFEIVVDSMIEQARAALAPPLDMVALGSPSSVRLFSQALRSLGLLVERCLAGVAIAVVGPATARLAIENELAPDLVAQGHLSDLMRDLKELWELQAPPPAGG